MLPTSEHTQQTAAPRAATTGEARTPVLAGSILLLHVLVLHLAVAWFRQAPPTEPVPAPAVVAAVDEQHLWADDTPDSVETVDEDAPAPPAAAAEPVEPAHRSGQAHAARAPVERPGNLRFETMRRDLDADGEETDTLVANLENGWTGELTLHAKLQRATQRSLDKGRMPIGAVVALDPRTGEVLALAERYDPDHPNAPQLPEGGPDHLALRAFAPAASVFKIITSAALVEAGVRPDKAVPYHHALRGLKPGHLEPPKPGARRASLVEALASSNNGYYGRISHLNLDRSELHKAAQRFGFNQVMPFPLATDASTAHIPRDDFRRAKVAAGFWSTRLTALHGALIAASVANGGEMPHPRLVKRLRGPDGDAFDAPERGPVARPFDGATARTLTRAMVRTTEQGTARKYFTGRRGSDPLVGVKIAGKTGHLVARNPITAYTWFVGFAPADDPEIAVAIVVGNGPLWWKNAHKVAREVLTAWFRHGRPHLAAR